MTFQNLDEVESEAETVDIGRDMEFWSDGEFARFGFDVESGRCIEIGLQDIEEFADAVEECETGHFSFSGRLGSKSYLFEANHPTVHVYHDQTHVASFVDYESYPLPEIRRRAREEFVDWDVADVGERILDGHTNPSDNVSVEKQGHHTAKATVENEFFSIAQMLRLCSIEEIERGYHPENVEAGSMDEFITHVTRFLENVQVRIDEDGNAVYKLQLDTRDYE